MTDSFVFDLIEKFNASSIVSLDYANGDSHIVLKKKDACASVAVGSAVSGAGSSMAATTAVASSGASASEVVAANDGDASETVDSPIVGTFYRSPSPDSPAYAEKGTTIKKGEPLCIIEAMKMMNTLTAEFDMEIVEVLVENGSLAEYGQPLFKVKRM
ncbi:MAG: acetyl-CoA carboxylase biotin carboxyl carrier protein [Spirochaetaceae bacterium]|nr:acetyl-CoA carboxylase biotin carboxyl carrier protein [Spirochaetaceae bacterium]